MSTVTLPAAPRRATTVDTTRRGVPRFGGLTPTLLRLEARRVLRNRRTMVFTLVMPVAFFFMFGVQDWAQQRYGRGNVAADIMIGMALYGALMATTGAGAAVSTERATGWSRQLRLTPLKPLAYIASKVVSGLLLSALAVAVVYVAGIFTHAHMPLEAWLVSALVVWLGSTVFVAFGLLIGYLLPTDNAMQVAGPLMAVMAFLGGMFMPLTPGSTMDHIGSLTPLYGLHRLALSPLGAGDFSWWSVLDVVVWLAIFLGGAAWRMSRDTARV